MAAPALSARTEKLGAVGLIGIAVLLFKLGLIDTLAAAEAGDSTLSISKGVVIAPAAFVLGTCVLVSGADSVRRFLSRPSLRDPNTQRLTPGGGRLSPVFCFRGWLSTFG
jgi:hypothetical protein